MGDVCIVGIGIHPFGRTDGMSGVEQGVFAVRAALNAHRDVVDVLHRTGAKPGFIANEVQGRFLMLGAQAGLIGLAGAALFVVLISRHAQTIADQRPQAGRTRT